jgi:hypothetical protein
MSAADLELQTREDRQFALAEAVASYLQTRPEPVRKGKNWREIVGIVPKNTGAISINKHLAFHAIVSMMNENIISSLSRKEQEVQQVMFPITSHFKARQGDRNKITTVEALRDEQNTTSTAFKLNVVAEKNIRQYNEIESMYRHMRLVKKALEEITNPDVTKRPRSEGAIKLEQAWIASSADMVQSDQWIQTEMQRRGVVAEKLAA